MTQTQTKPTIKHSWELTGKLTELQDSVSRSHYQLQDMSKILNDLSHKYDGQGDKAKKVRDLRSEIGSMQREMHALHDRIYQSRDSFVAGLGDEAIPGKASGLGQPLPAPNSRDSRLGQAEQLHLGNPPLPLPDAKGVKSMTGMAGLHIHVPDITDEIMRRMRAEEAKNKTKADTQEKEADNKKPQNLLSTIVNELEDIATTVEHFTKELPNLADSAAQEIPNLANQVEPLVIPVADLIEAKMKEIADSAVKEFDTSKVKSLKSEIKHGYESGKKLLTHDLCQDVLKQGWSELGKIKKLAEDAAKNDLGNQYKKAMLSAINALKAIPEDLASASYLPKEADIPNFPIMQEMSQLSESLFEAVPDELWVIANQMLPLERLNEINEQLGTVKTKHQHAEMAMADIQSANANQPSVKAIKDSHAIAPRGNEDGGNSNCDDDDDDGLSLGAKIAISVLAPFSALADMVADILDGIRATFPLSVSGSFSIDNQDGVSGKVGVALGVLVSLGLGIDIGAGVGGGITLISVMAAILTPLYVICTIVSYVLKFVIAGLML